MAGGDVCSSESFNEDIAVFAKQVGKDTVNSSLTLLLLVPFSYKLMHHLKPFATVVLNGEITVYSVDSPNGFEW